MPSFCLIGEDSLLIHCGNELIQKNQTISWVVSPREEIKNWAESQNLAWVPSLNEWLKKSPAPVDYIFSIVNSFILNHEILKIAKKGVINYHDSLLPKYAGLNATTWSIFYGEPLHGVSWHWVDLGIDTGALVKQVTFPITKDETALSLNLKCYEAAIRSFKELLYDIENNNISMSSQDQNKRSYFGSNHVLPGAGFIHWQHYNAQFISQINRATTLGNYKNHVGLLKLFLNNNDFIIPTKIHVLETENSNAVPGTILALQEKKIKVATLSHPIILEEFISPTGIILHLDKLIKSNNWSVGEKLLAPQSQQTENWRFFYALALKNEAWWVKKIKSMTEHTTFTIAHMKNLEDCVEKIATINFSLEKMNDYSLKYIVFTSILIYLYRLNNYERTSLSLFCPPDKTLEKDYHSLFSNQLPFTIEWQANQPLYELLNQTKLQLEDYLQKKTYLKDTIARYPELNHNARNGIIINLTNTPPPPEVLSQALIYFEFSETKGKLSVFHRLNLDSQGQLLRSLIYYIKDHLQNIFNQLTHNPHVLISEFCFLPEKERLLLTYKWGKGKQVTLPKHTISALFEEQVKLQGQHVALITTNGQKITFKELSKIVNQIYGAIQQLQLQSQTLIGVYLKRDVHLIASLLAILKADCVYVPLDIKSPLIKIEHIAKEARLEWIISTKEQCQFLNKHFKGKQLIHCLTLESLLKNKYEEKKQTYEKKLRCQLTYIMFTSGSTGAPKGVVVSQTNIINYCTWFIKTTHFNADSIIDFSSSIAFDLSVPCTLVPLISGGCIALCDERTKANPAAYLKHLQAHEVTHIELIPSYMELLLAHPKLIKKLTQLRVLLLGADTLHTTETLQWLNLCPSHQIINEYGPTETTVAVTSYPIFKEEISEENGSVPIGRPAFNSLAFVLDKHLNLCPIGMKGHLHIGGPQVTNGYFFKPHLTQKKFVSLSFYNKAEVFYNTGDLTAWLPKGQLQFFGRDDFQVKIHGYRIELIEIESTLMRHSDIQQAVVVVLNSSTDDKFLRAYLVPEKKQSLSLTEIKEFLANYVPFYMIPKEFCLIDKMPMRDNGKIDLNALNHQNYKLLTFDYQINESLNVWEQNLMKIWQQIFNTIHINITDDFFDLGGNSLIALHIINEVKQLYEVSIPLSHLFKYSNIHKLAQYIENSLINEVPSTSSPVILLAKGKKPIPLFFIHPVGGSIFWYQPLAESLRGNYTVYGIQDPNFMGEAMPFQSLEEMASFYIKAIKEIYPGDKFALGGASFGATVAFEMARQLQEKSYEISYLALFDGWTHYPEKLMEKNTANLLSQDEAKFLKMEQKKEFYQLEQWRKSLLLNYTFSKVSVNASLFKAFELWEDFRENNQADNGWNDYVLGKLTTHIVPGNHETMMFHPNVHHLTQWIKKEFPL